MMWDKALHGLSGLLGVIATVSVVILMLAIALDVAFRFTTGASIPGMVELAESSLVVAAFFGLAWAGIQNEHISVQLVGDRVSERTNRVFDLVGWSLSTAILAWISYATVMRAIESLQRQESRFGLLEWPLYPWRWVIAIGLAAMLLVAATNVVRTLTGRGPYGADDVAASDTDAPPSERGASL